jgi:Phosphotransferase enzyme family
VIVFHTDGSQVLLAPKGTHFVLPEVEVPPFERVPEHLTSAARRDWGQDIVCLLSLPDQHSSEIPHSVSYHVAEALDPKSCMVPSRWVSIDGLRTESFLDVRDYQALQYSLAQCSRDEANSRRQPFEKLGWLPEAREWIAKAIEPFGLHLSGPFRQCNASPTFSLIRFDTSGPAVWFKAVGEPNLREFSITRELSRFFPAFVPRILSVREDWNAWLALEAKGIHPDRNSKIETWTTVARTLAEFQIATIGNTLHLLEAGFFDARIPALLDMVDPFLGVMAGLMQRQATQTPPPLTQLELETLRRQLQDALFTLQDSDIPDTLGHLDFNPGNLVVSRDRCVFLDWAEGCVGHPFLTFQYLLEHLRRIRPCDPQGNRTVVASYIAPWQSLFTSREIHRAMAPAPLVAVFAYAAVGGRWRDTIRLHEPRTAAYLRSLTRRMKREADGLEARRTHRRVACLV